MNEEIQADIIIRNDVIAAWWKKMFRNAARLKKKWSPRALISRIPFIDLSMSMDKSEVWNFWVTFDWTKNNFIDEYIKRSYGVRSKSY